jgi:hypothetical protein
MAEINRPIVFEGSVEERAANYATHYFSEGRCVDCDSRSTGVSASYPCGAEIPRETIIVPDEDANAVILNGLFNGGR